MINPFVIKKYGALTLSAMLTTICFYIGLITMGFIWSFVFLCGGLLMSILIGTIMLQNPFTQMLEGKGILAINLDSTGVISPFIVGVKSPYIEGKINNERVNDVFDRATVYNLRNPIKLEKKAELKKSGGIIINIDEDSYNKARFGMFQYPVIIWNNQIKTVITKDFLSGQEKETFAEHAVLYLNRKTEELTSAIRDFGRYVVDLTRPKENFWQSAAAKWILIGGIILILILIIPKIIPIIQGSAGAFGKVAAKTPTIVPR